MKMKVVLVLVEEWGNDEDTKTEKPQDLKERTRPSPCELSGCIRLCPRQPKRK